ncbi:MAG: GNAT family N-acetyltransferase [Burkholderiaceae bacterium]|nr:GNAT family N-acetyltransferase [Burkholderiaceae bacterium]MDO9088992.1 GNAT family N-acetyltransferase [Burkholderiaceae bacterium]
MIELDEAPQATSGRLNPPGQALAGSLVIEARGIGKAYYPHSSPASALLAALSGSNRRSQPFWALHPMDLSVQRGEVLGLVGHNGAGKSTLLQMISGTLSPSVGRLQVRGRVAALLELGAGFNPEFSGRENLLLNGPLMGLSRQQLAARLDEIIEFSGIEAFIDQPVKTYSSGMFVRLAFSLATSVEPDILVIDEALSVGDGEFARKSFDRILKLRDQGTTILFCSHSMYQIESLCTRAVWLDHGQVKRVGRPADVTTAYQEHLDQMSAPAGMRADGAAPALVVTSPGHARIKTLQLACDGRTGAALQAVSGRSNIELTLGFESDPTLDAPNAAVTLNGADGRILASSGTWIDGVRLQRSESGHGTVHIRFPALPLLKGSYTFSAYLFCERGLHIYSAAEKFATLAVEQHHLEQGIVSIPHQWSSEAGMAQRADVPVQAGSDGPGALVLPAEWTPHWQTRWSVADDLPALQDLFTEAFGKPMSQRRWHWKYRQSPTWGTLVEREGVASAFFGGMPRAFMLAGKPVAAVQIGDVMVRPSERGVLSRTGPMFRAAAAYFGNMAALYPEVRFAFGFPSQRHVRLGLKLGLYAQADAISELSWPALAPKRSWQTKTRGIDHLPDAAGALDRLWREMQLQWPGWLLPVRDAARWQYRYADHPEHSYRVLLIRRRIGGRPIAAVALREHATHLEWLDYLGPLAGVAVAQRAVRMRAGELQLPQVRGWFSSVLVDLFADADATVTPTEVQVPINRWGRDDAQLPAPIWLMAGDTDFL